MFDELKDYKQGHFFIKPGQKLSEVSKDIPNKPGIYLTYRLARGSVELVFIGKSGNIGQDGRFGKKLLKQSLNEKEDGTSLQEFFDSRYKDENIDALDIYWFVTYDAGHRDLPGYVWALIMQHHFDVHQKLPVWNKQF